MITMTNDKWSWWPHTWSRVWTDLDRPRQWLVLVAIMITSIADIIIMMPIAIHDHQDHYKSSNPDILFDIITSKWLVKKLWFDQHHHVFIIAKFLYPPHRYCQMFGQGVHRPRPPSSHLSLRSLARYFIRATLIINLVKLSIAMINNLLSLGMGWTRIS